MYLLDKDLVFPPVELASEEGLLAVGGDLSSERLLLAYRHGIFPWFGKGDPILWWSPDPRMVLFPEDLRVSSSMRKVLKRNSFEITFNRDFPAVIAQCASVSRKDQDDTWITREMKEAYIRLHESGFAVSVEVWQEDELAGGLYGIDLGHVFCGESMFSKVSNASKAGFITLVEKLKKENYKLVDCQVYTAHLASLGAREIPRNAFIRMLTGENRTSG
ncbi:leucyl/phenylalanyl-tRNA--protein transferase [Sinomicrobium soli]|uniref:leucyl/phenylalanyl-tRNA--protein transferase n=1 Tax=Sinomicrobium sp. N-1-3-6 TaxID=2219864 RepID=UPI000DCBB549|nr:leucyl/phenylalanyl-tRNA--protein transferase [Sinomicrobium sp. N-1-3-6]RAV28539.1 leucyl/phenylalanyl-tRNA--protein transferase [Sinomicrobium sp. N-1-3-6]